MQHSTNCSSRGFDRVPPHSDETEHSLISTLLINNADFDLCDWLDPGEFYSRQNQTIFRAMLTMRAKRVPVDLVTLAEELKERNEIDVVGGYSRLAEIADAAPMALNCEAYAKIISDLAVKRSAIALGQQIFDMGFKSDAAELVDFAQSEVLKLQQNKRDDNIVRVGDLIGDHLDRLLQNNDREQVGGFQIGFSQLDSLLNIAGPKLIIVAGRPAMGKTAFAVTIMRNLARRNIQSGFLSIEMGRDEILNRWLAMESGVNSMKFNQYQALTQSDTETLQLVSGQMYEWPIQIDDTGSIWIEDVERKCRKMKRDGAQIIFVDQLSKIRGRTGDQFRDYTENCNRIADLKKELEMPIVLLAQLNRELEKRNDKRPTLSDLKNTGALEEDADIILFLFRPEYYINPKTDELRLEKEQLRDAAEISIAKNRSGATFLDKTVRFDHGRGMFWQADRNYGESGY